MSDGVEILEVAIHAGLLDIAENGGLYTTSCGQVSDCQASGSTRRGDGSPEQSELERRRFAGRLDLFI
ncbi:hypothetical protein GCM10010435_54490 [Winogradskya consettensis]|uniref:Uncharacterized protein n=1 Tax=Winogradskya consettensis TaxID=113560 RepID=A0A919SGA6_9ACTN|nr:hypothetical protein [Actinoplanes consettensis]GIM71386.1 hypothetical protein Aco04nite_24960 [Actinoplanes consettensis]